ncbi:hypothetical protein C8R44DRAFT_742663 [Mycena epipterygia]|nr:hypothetical protein C8R44DRAFT_742663 [Mycena epipterygia]
MHISVATLCSLSLQVESGVGVANPSTTSVKTFSPVVWFPTCELLSHSDPLSPKGKFIADASGYLVEAPVKGSMVVVESCRLGSNGVGICVLELPFPIATTTTISGAVVPFYTFVTTPHSSASRSTA